MNNLNIFFHLKYKNSYLLKIRGPFDAKKTDLCGCHLRKKLFLNQTHIHPDIFLNVLFVIFIILNTLTLKSQKSFLFFSFLFFLTDIASSKKKRQIPRNLEITQSTKKKVSFFTEISFNKFQM